MTIAYVFRMTGVIGTLTQTDVLRLEMPIIGRNDPAAAV